MSLCLRGNGDENDKERYQSRSQRDLRNDRQPFGIAIPDKGEDVDDKVANVDMPWLYDATRCPGSAMSIRYPFPIFSLS